MHVRVEHQIPTTIQGSRRVDCTSPYFGAWWNFAVLYTFLKKKKEQKVVPCSFPYLERVPVPSSIDKKGKRSSYCWMGSLHLRQTDSGTYCDSLSGAVRCEAPKIKSPDLDQTATSVLRLMRFHFIDARSRINLYSVHDNLYLRIIQRGWKRFSR